MVTTKKIPVRKAITDVFGKPILMAKRDESGEIIWKHKPAERDCEKCGTRQGHGGIPESEDTSTEGAIRVLIGSIPRDILTTQDGIHAGRLWSQVVRELSDKGQVGTGSYYEIAEAEYEWLEKALNKKVPLTKEEVEQNKNQPDDESRVKPRTVAQHVWGVNAYQVEKQLRARHEEGDTEED